MEYNIIGELLTEGLDVYTPLVDDHGVDAIIKRPMELLLNCKLKREVMMLKILEHLLILRSMHN